MVFIQKFLSQFILRFLVQLLLLLMQKETAYQFDGFVDRIDYGQQQLL